MRLYISEFLKSELFSETRLRSAKKTNIQYLAERNRYMQAIECWLSNSTD
jgi:hypothetical protein